MRRRRTGWGDDCRYRQLRLHHRALQAAGPRPLAEGRLADLMLFDPKTVGRGEKRRVQDLPAGATRVDTSAVGLHGVWVNGVRTVDTNGENLSDCGKPGQLLRDFADRV